MRLTDARDLGFGCHLEIEIIIEAAHAQGACQIADGLSNSQNRKSESAKHENDIWSRKIFEKTPTELDLESLRF